MITLERFKMTTTKELETVVVDGIKLDVHFNYTRDYGFEIHSVEDITGVQDLTNLFSEWVLDRIYLELEDLYRRNGWL